MRFSDDVGITFPGNYPEKMPHVCTGNGTGTKIMPENLPRPTKNLPAREIRATKAVGSFRHPDKLTKTIRVI